MKAIKKDKTSYLAVKNVIIFALFISILTLGTLLVHEKKHNTELSLENMELQKQIPAYTIYEVGDVNGDGKISVLDYSFVKSYLLGNIVLNSTELYRADLNGDGVVDETDLEMIKEIVLLNKE